MAVLDKITKALETGENEWDDESLTPEYHTAFMTTFVERVERVVSNLPVITGSSEMTEAEFYDAKVRCANMEREDLSYLYTEFEAMLEFVTAQTPQHALMLFGTYFCQSPACARVFSYMRTHHRESYARFVEHIKPFVGEDPFAETLTEKLNAV